MKKAFRGRMTQKVRQNRAAASIAYYLFTTAKGRCVQGNGFGEYVIWLNHFVLAASEHTEKLASKIRTGRDLLKDKDKCGRTLLYIACMSGFYDTCELLLEEGASINVVQSTGSTPLHGAAYYRHTLVVGLLLQHGAKTDIKNQAGMTALDESTTPDIQRLIQTASADKILSFTAELRDKCLVERVRLIKYQGDVVAKELIRNQSTLDEDTRAQWNGICRKWDLAWHGTRFKHLESIMKDGLFPAGSNGIMPEPGHFTLDKEYLNWSR